MLLRDEVGVEISRTVLSLSESGSVGYVSSVFAGFSIKGAFTEFLLAREIVRCRIKECSKRLKGLPPLVFAQDNGFGVFPSNVCVSGEAGAWNFLTRADMINSSSLFGFDGMDLWLGCFSDKGNRRTLRFLVVVSGSWGTVVVWLSLTPEDVVLPIRRREARVWLVYE